MTRKIIQIRFNIFCTIQTKGEEGADKAEGCGKINGFHPCSMRDMDSELETRETKVKICTHEGSKDYSMATAPFAALAKEHPSIKAPQMAYRLSDSPEPID